MSNKQALFNCTFSWGKTCRLYRDSIEIAGKSYNLDDLTYIHPTYQKLFGVASARLELCFGLRRLTLRGIADPEAARQMVSHLQPYAEQAGPDTIAHRLRARSTQARDLARVQAKAWERTQKMPALLDASRPNELAASAEPAAAPIPEHDDTLAAPPSGSLSASLDAFDDFLDVAAQSTLHIPSSALPPPVLTSSATLEETPSLVQQTGTPDNSSSTPDQPTMLIDALVPEQPATPDSSLTPEQPATLAVSLTPDQTASLAGVTAPAQPAVFTIADLCSLPDQPTSTMSADPVPAPAQTPSTDSAPEDAALPKDANPASPVERPAPASSSHSPLPKKRSPRIPRFDPPLRPVQLVHPLAPQEPASESGEQIAKAPLSSHELQEVPHAQAAQQQSSLPSEPVSKGSGPGAQSVRAPFIPRVQKKPACMAENKLEQQIPEGKTLTTRVAPVSALKSNVLPIIHVPVHLQPGEYAHYSIEAALCSDRSTGSASASYPPLDHGLLILTNRRIFYLGKRCQLILAYTHLWRVSLLHNAIALHIEGQLRRIIMEIEHPQAWTSRIEQLASVARRSPQVAPMFVLPGIKPASPPPVTVKRAALKLPSAQEEVALAPADASSAALAQPAGPQIAEATTIELAPRIDSRIIETTTVEFAPDTDQSIVEATTITFCPQSTESIVEATTIAFDLQAAQSIVEAVTIALGPQASGSLAEVTTVDLGLHILDNLAAASLLKFPLQHTQEIENQITGEFPPLAKQKIENQITDEFPPLAEQGIENQVTNEFPPLAEQGVENIVTREFSPFIEQKTVEMGVIAPHEPYYDATVEALKPTPRDEDEDMPPYDGNENLSTSVDAEEGEVTGKFSILSAPAQAEQVPLDTCDCSLQEQEDDVTGKLAAIVVDVQAEQDEDEQTMPLRLRNIAALNTHPLRPGSGQLRARKTRPSAHNRLLSRARFPREES